MTIEKENKFHCLYAGISNKHSAIICCYPGMEYVDALCSGYDKCKQYKIGSRKIDKEQMFSPNLIGD